MFDYLLNQQFDYKEQKTELFDKISKLSNRKKLALDLIKNLSNSQKEKIIEILKKNKINEITYKKISEFIILESKENSKILDFNFLKNLIENEKKINQGEINLNKLLEKNQYSTEIKNIEFPKNYSFENINFEDIKFEDCKFNCLLNTKNQFKNVIFNKCEMNNFSFINSKIESSQFIKCKIGEMNGKSEKEFVEQAKKYFSNFTSKNSAEQWSQIELTLESLTNSEKEDFFDKLAKLCRSLMPDDNIQEIYHSLIKHLKEKNYDQSFIKKISDSLELEKIVAPLVPNYVFGNDHEELLKMYEETIKEAIRKVEDIKENEKIENIDYTTSKQQFNQCIQFYDSIRPFIEKNIEFKTKIDEFKQFQEQLKSLQIMFKLNDISVKFKHINNYKQEWIKQFIEIIKSEDHANIWAYISGAFLDPTDFLRIQSAKKIISLEEIDKILILILEKANGRDRKQLREIHKALIEYMENTMNNTNLSEILNEQFYSKLYILNPLIKFSKDEKEKIKETMNTLLHLKDHYDITKAIEIAHLLNQNSEKETIKISPFAREPIEYLEKKEGLVFVEEKFARFITYEKFRSALRNTFFETLKEIIRLPKEEREYVILADGGEKSTNWVTTHLLDMMSVHPPQAIVSRDDLAEYLNNHPNVEHIVMVDDGAYSGEQAARYIGGLDLRGKKFHVNIPYMSNYAKKRINTALINQMAEKSYFPARQLMLTYKELDDTGHFGYQKMHRLDIQKFLELKDLEIKNNLTRDEKVNVQNCQETINKMKKTIFKNKSTSLEVSQRMEIEDLRKEIEKIENLIDHGEDLLKELDAILSGIERFGVNQTARESEKQVYILQDGQAKFQSRTGTWMAHKSADDVSTDENAMRRAAADPIDNAKQLKNKSKNHFFEIENENVQVGCSLSAAIEPYKNNYGKTIKREGRILTLQAANPTIVTDWNHFMSKLSILSGDAEIVKTNRGIFLLGNNYINNSDEKTNITIISEGKNIPFGGKDGAFQFEIKEGIPFTIEKENHTGTFIYKEGKIQEYL